MSVHLEARGQDSLELQNQSGEMTTAPAVPYTSEQNVEFTDSDPGYAYDLDTQVDPTRTLQDSDDVELNNFFSRPLKIADYDWSSSTTFGETINPWQLYFENPRVSNRISNYKLLRCKMNVKIVVNGTQFHYGRMLVAYEPLAPLNQGAEITTLVRQDMVRASQLPHIFIDPCSSQGGTLELPFMWHLNYLSIPDSSWQDMGSLYLRELNALKHANGAENPVTISVFAWATDVQLSVLTSVDTSTLQPQAGEKKKKSSNNTMSAKTSGKTKGKPGMSAPKDTERTEANTTGIVSGPATAVAKVAGALKAVPFLTPFATATEMAANTTAGIAKLFGYSRPTVTTDPAPFKPRVISDLATTTVPDNCDKFTVDDKQELSIDTRIAGIESTDSLSIKSIAGRESYLTTFQWSPSNPPEEMLWNARVMPTIWDQSGPTNQLQYHFPACCVAALPFQYWTGSMTFRFQVVKSNFHKGRLKLVYDPEYFGSNEYNTNYLHVVDITEKTDFSITIGNGQDRTLLSRFNPGLTSRTEVWSKIPYTSKDNGNGVLGVYVVNSLAVPSTDINNDIEINVFVKMEDDFEVFVPVDDFAAFSFGTNLPPPPPRIIDCQSGEMSPTEVIPAFGPDDQDNMPVQDESCDLGPSMQDNSLINKVWTGEAIESFRPLLKRYALWNAFGNDDDFPGVITGRSAMMPYFRGFVPGAINTEDLNGFGYNYCNTLLMHYITRCYAGWRGSTRWKILPRGQINSLTAYVQRSPVLANSSENPWSFRVDELDTPLNQPTRSSLIMKSSSPNSDQPTIGINGNVYRTDSINPAVEFEMPFYNDKRFIPGKWLNYTTLTAGRVPDVEKFEFRLFLDAPSTSSLDVHCAAGDDFQVYMWTGMPRMFFELRAPPPAP